MYPHETPYGIIMKVNRAPLPELNQEIVDRDHKFWDAYSERLVGNWITYDTPVTNICAFAEKLYLRRDFRGFKGDPKFIRDDDAQKNFSKLRGAQGGLYLWRWQHPKSIEDQKRMMKEAIFAFKQAFAYCPYSPEAVGRLCLLLVADGHHDDAAAVAKVCLKLDPGSGTAQNIIDQIQVLKTANAMNLPALLAQATNYVSKGMTNEAVAIADGIMASTNLDLPTVVACAQIYVQSGDYIKLESVLARLVKAAPDSPEAWYDLAALRASLNKPGLALDALERCVIVNNRRQKLNPNSRNLVPEIIKDPRFEAIRNSTQFRKIVNH
jgi:tetratricopeptide (TPR) repeat protein